MADDRIEIEIVLDDGTVKKSFTNVKNEGKKTAGAISSSFKKFAAVAVGVGASLAAAFAGRKIIQAAAAQEAAVQELNTSLRLAGSFSREASEGFQAFAAELQSTTRFGDEAILQQLALARNFARSNDEAKELVKTAVDLSEATGISLDSAVRNLGKTFSGLTGELGEAVPQIRGLTAEQLKAGEAIKVLADRFGGAAQANVQTFSGRIQQLQNIFGDLLEQIGFIATKSPVLSTVFGFISEKLKEVSLNVKGFAQSGDVLGVFLSKLAKFAQGVNTFVVAPIELVVNSLDVVFNGLRTGLQSFIGTFAGAASAISSFFAPGSQISKTLQTFKQSADDTFLSFATQTEESLNSVFNFETASSIGLFLEELNFRIDDTLNKTAELSNVGGENIKKFASKLGNSAKKAEFDIKTRIGAGISNAIQSTIKALTSGENAFSAFAKATLNVIGDLAIQLGQFFIINGIAVEALKSLGGAAAIAAGIALVALGSLLKSAGGGGAGVGATTTPTADGGVISPAGTLAADIDEDEEVVAEDRTKVAINIQGDVLDSRETGLRIVDILNESFDTEGTVLAASV